MATFSASWSSASSLRSAAALNTGSSLNDDLNLATDGGFECELTDAITIGSGTPAGDVTIYLYGSADGGTTIDTEPLLVRKIAFSTTGTKTVTLRGIRGSWTRRTITNSTGANATLTTKYRYLEQVSA